MTTPSPRPVVDATPAELAQAWWESRRDLYRARRARGEAPAALFQELEAEMRGFAQGARGQ